MTFKSFLERASLWSGIIQGVGAIAGWFTGGGRIISCFIALVAVLWLTIKILRKRGLILFPPDIKRIINEVDDVRSMYVTSESLNASWPSKYAQLLSNLQPVFQSLINRVLNPLVVDMVMGGVVWIPEDGSRKDAASLRSAFEETLCVFSGRKVLQAVRNWRISGRVKSAPTRGIDAKIDPEIRNQIAQRIVERFHSWLSSSRRRNSVVSVLLIGANDQKLSRMILEGMRNIMECIGINLYIRGTANENEMFLKNLFGTDDESSNHNKIRVQPNEIGMYDVAIVTHYYQHHDFNHYQLVNIPVVEGGLLLWLSAISRARNFDEYVCEGCMPKRAHVSNHDGRGGIPFASMKQSGRKSYIFYEPFKEFAPNRDSVVDHTPILAMGFPKKFIVATKSFRTNRAGVVREYLEWEQRNGLSELLKKSELYKDKAALSIPEIVDAKCLYVIQSNDGQYDYSVVVLYYKVAGRTRQLHFIVTTGSEYNEWNGRNIAQQSCLVTMNPALYLDCHNSVNGSLEQIEVLLRETIEELEKGEQDRSDRYLNSINSETTKIYDGEAAVCEIKTDIKEADLNHLILYLVNSVENRGNARCYYSYLPKRRYLTPIEYGAEYEFMEEFKRIVDSLDNSSREYFAPVLSHSVTWLRCFSGLKKFLAHEGFVVEDGTNGLPDNCFFHKCIGNLTHEETIIIEQRMSQVCDKNVIAELMKKQHSAKKDIAFNVLPMNIRLSLIPAMNVHDVLLSAVKITDNQAGFKGRLGHSTMLRIKSKIEHCIRCR